MDVGGSSSSPDLSGALHHIRDEFVDVLRSARVLEVRGARLSEPERLEVVEEIARRAEQAIDTLDEALSSPEFVARQRPPVSPVAPAVHQIAAELEPVARSRGVELALGAPSGLYAAMPVDALRQVLRNLVLDACRFGQPGSVVQVRARRDGADVVVDVVHRSDPEAPDQRVAALDAATLAALPSASAGTALGVAGAAGGTLTLKVVRALVEAFGGTTTVSARHGRVTFSVAVPAVGVGHVNGRRSPASLR